MIVFGSDGTKHTAKSVEEERLQKNQILCQLEQYLRLSVHTCLILA